MQPRPAPLFDDRMYLTDGGLETTLVFLDGIDLPAFAAFPLVETENGRAHLRAYFRRYMEVAVRLGAGFVLESPTWRANPDWGAQLGYMPEDLERVNRTSIQLLARLRDELAFRGTHGVVSGCIGPQGDGYAPKSLMDAEQAERYHAPQVRTFAAEGADVVTAMTLTYAAEAIGIARAARKHAIPCVLSFTVETDGCLPSGQSLESALGEVDAATDGYVAYYMINCAHPTHFDHVLANGTPWARRIGGVRANASCMSHEELDNAEALDDGNPAELGFQYASLLKTLPALRVLGGCCGTDHRHIHAIAGACAPRFVAARA